MTINNLTEQEITVVQEATKEATEMNKQQVVDYLSQRDVVAKMSMKKRELVDLYTDYQLKQFQFNEAGKRVMTEEENNTVQEEKEMNNTEMISIEDVQKMIQEVKEHSDDIVNNLATENERLRAQIQELTSQKEQPKEEYSMEDLQKVADRINQFHGKDICTVHTPINILKEMLDDVRKKQKDAPAVDETSVAEEKNKGEVPMKKQEVEEIIQNMSEEERNEVVFTKEEAKILESQKQTNPQLYAKTKESMEKVNRMLGRTVENVLRYPTRFEETAHEAVDSTHVLVGNVINGLKEVATGLINTTAQAAHGVNNAGKQLGHLVIDGVVYTFDSAGNVFQSKENKVTRN